MQYEPMTPSELCSYGPYLGLSVAQVSMRMWAVSVGGTARGNCAQERLPLLNIHDNSDDLDNSVDEDAAAPDQTPHLVFVEKWRL